MEDKKQWQINKDKYNANYRKNKLKSYQLSFHKELDKNIIDKLESVPNKKQYIKSLIENDLGKSKK